MSPLLLIAIYREKPVWALDVSHVDRIRRAAGGRFEVFQAHSDGEFLSHLPDAEVMFGFRLTAETLPSAAKLKWVQATSAGVERALFPEFVRSGITLTSASGIHAVQMSEHALMMMLGLSRRLPHFILFQAAKKWDRSVGDQLGELHGKTLGILGLGAIGEALAVRAKALGMRVTGVKASPLGYRGAADEVLAPAGMERVFREADFIVNLLPITDATRGVVSSDLIALMKPSSFFINLGRGRTVDQKALVASLAKGKISGAGLDVFAEEPLPKNSRLWKMDNVIVTPHVGGLTPEYWSRATALFCDNLSRYVAGRELTNVVDPQLGY